MSQQPQGPDELQTPPILAQLTSIFVSIGFFVGMVILLGGFGSINFLIAGIVAALPAYYLTLSGLSRLFTGSWLNYPKKQKNVDMSD